MQRGPDVNRKNPTAFNRKGPNIKIWPVFSARSRGKFPRAALRRADGHPQPRATLRYNRFADVHSLAEQFFELRQFCRNRLLSLVLAGQDVSRL